MGLFGSRAKPEPEIEQQMLPSQAEQYEDIPSLPTPRTSTVIAEGVTMAGKLYGEGVIQVEGAVEGEIDLKGAVIVTTTGCVHGPISADVIHVAGSVEGNVVARDHLRLEKSGTLEGDAETVSLVVEDGGRLNGRTTMMKQDGTPKPRPKEDLQFGRNYKAEEEEEGAQ
jgi:cytoskeletal protein CcmA (bactofilin family)